MGTIVIRHEFSFVPSNEGDTLMATLNEINTKITEVLSEIEEANAKTDALIAVATVTKETLEALRAAGGATQADLDALIARLQDGIDSLNQQDLETDAAKLAVGDTP